MPVSLKLTEERYASLTASLEVRSYQPKHTKAISLVINFCLCTKIHSHTGINSNMATKRALDAIKRIRKNVEDEAVAAGNRRWADAPNYSNVVNKYLEAKLPDGRSAKDLGQNWNKLRADFPHSRGFIDTLQNFYEDREKSINALPIGFTPAVHEAVLAKARDVVRFSHCLTFPDHFLTVHI